MDPNRKFWNQQQQALRKALSKPEEHQTSIRLFLSQHAMVHSAAVSESGLWSFEDEIWHGLNDDDVRYIPPGGEHSIVWMIWHIARIEDVTMNMLLAGCPQIFKRDGWVDQLSLPFYDTGNAMDPANIVTLSIQINIKALREYRVAVGLRTRQIVKQLTPSDLKQKVSSSRLNSVLEAGVVVDAARGLLDYWGGLTHAGLLLMPPTRHNFIHLNEALRGKGLVGRKR